MIIFDPSAPGYGLFSLPGMAMLLAALLIMNAIHPASLTISRVSEMLRRRIPRSAHDTAAAGAITSGYITRGPPLLAGYALFFAYFFTTVFTLETSSMTQAVRVLAAPGNLIPTLAILGMSLTSGFLDGLVRGWRINIIPKISTACKLGSAGGIVVLAIHASLGLLVSMLLVALVSAMRTSAGIIMRCMYLHGTAGPVSASGHLALWVATTFVISHIGPLERLLRPFCDQPGGGGLDIGLKRDKGIREDTSLLDVNTTLDSLAGMRAAR